MSVDPEDARAAALKRIKARRDFAQHMFVYFVVNVMLIAIWATTGHGYFWPMWVLLGWGIGVVMNAWAVYARPISEDEIRRELDRHPGV